VCVDDAVTKTPNGTPFGQGLGKSQSQSVVFKTSMIDKMSDITDTLNVSEVFQVVMDWCS
jgi:hypothetical protein